MSNFLIFKAAFNNSATPAIGTYTAEGATALFNMNSSLSPDYYLYNTADDTAVQWFVPTAETTDFEFVADILTRQWTDSVTYFIIADSTGTTRLRMWSVNDNWHFENSDSIATTGDPEYIGTIDPITSGGFEVFHQFRVRVRKLTASSSSVEVYVDGTLKLTATAGAALVTCAKIGFVGGVSTFGPGVDAGVKNAYVYDLSGRELVDRGVLSGAFNRFINWAKGSFIPLAGSNQISGDLIPATDNAYNLGDSTYGFASFYANKIYLKGSTIFNVVDDNYICVGGATAQANGANIVLNGKDTSTSAGEFKLEARDGTNTRQLIGKPDGSLSWSGTALHFTNTSDYTHIRRNATDYGLYIYAGRDWGDGATIALTGKTNANKAGIFYINVAAGSQNKSMYLYPDGNWTWTGTAVQLISDQRFKQQISKIDDKLLDAWEDVDLVQFKYNDAVKEKSDNARLHTGYVVQQIDEACKSHGVDVSKYGLYCHEEYAEETREVEHEDGTKTTEVVRPANEHYSLRYTEALIVECAYLRKCIKELRNEIEELKSSK